MSKKVIAVWFSCGAASAVALKKTVEIYGETHTVIAVNNPVDEEDEDNRRFLNDVGKWVGVEILTAVNEDLGHTSAVKLWDKFKFMAGIRKFVCTPLLKKEARYQFEKKNTIDFHVLGFTFEEKGRHERFVKFERENVLPVLIDLEITKGDCFREIEAAGIELPRMYKLGYPNANCIGCVKASSPTYWNHVRRVHPEVFAARSEQSRRVGARLVRYKGKRIFLDELPAAAMGRKMKSYECGIFCDTK